MDIRRVFDLGEKGLEPYTQCNEPQLLHYFEPDGGIFIAETPLVIERAINSGCEPLSFFVEEKALETGETRRLLEGASVPVYAAPLDVINKLTGFNLTRGMLSAMHRPAMPKPEWLLEHSDHIVFLEDVENPTNVGALFRDAAALGADSVILTKNSADPLYRRAARVSMGTVFQIPWLKTSPDEALCDLKRAGFTVIAMALADDALPLDDPLLDDIERSVVVFGNERTGITEKTLRLCDYKVMIPMKNGVDSLNVASAGAVAFWRLFKEER